MHLIKLREILESYEETVLFPCVVDLVENGIQADRFSSHEQVSSRQDVTQFLATWFKYINVAPEVCQDWLIDYCTSVLSAISSSSKSQIRHSTKSNVKYVYGSAVEFNCRCTENSFKATCNPSCKAYDEMIHKDQNSSSFLIDEFNDNKFEQDVAPVLSSKEKYKEQFIEAANIIRIHYGNNLARKEIVKILNDQGFKTRTGKSWTIGILGHELKNIERKKQNCLTKPSSRRAKGARG
jgi:hypothetical protein